MTGSINIMQERITRARMAGDPRDPALPAPWQPLHHGFPPRERRHQRGEACVERNLEQLKEELSRLCLI